MTRKAARCRSRWATLTRSRPGEPLRRRRLALHHDLPHAHGPDRFDEKRYETAFFANKIWNGQAGVCANSACANPKSRQPHRPLDSLALRSLRARHDALSQDYWSTCSQCGLSLRLDEYCDWYLGFREAALVGRGSGGGSGGRAPRVMAHRVLEGILHLLTRSCRSRPRRCGRRSRTRAN